MYQILLVDDELPALRFLQTIVEKYAPDFSVISSQRDGTSALLWLKEHVNEVDLIMTDIRMPDMDGITLAKAARNLRKDLHIVIVSGYSEFDYAHGAIEASVDDYILKPVSVSHMKELLEKIRIQLDETKGNRLDQELTALLNGQTCDNTFLTQLFHAENYYFALLRLGNVIYPQAPLSHTKLLPLSSLAAFSLPESDSFANIRVFAGRDEQEFLFFAPASGTAVTFQNALRKLAQTAASSMVTIIFTQGGIPFSSLKVFYPMASKVLRHTAVIGHYAELVLTSSNAGNKAAKEKIPPTVLKRLEICIREGDIGSVRKMFQDLGKEWEQKSVTQRQAYVMMQQLLHLTESLRRTDYESTEEIMTEADLLTNTASSYSELLQDLFALLFDDTDLRTRQMRPEEMYQYAVKTISEKFEQPISIQSVCSEIGISQTYLSRLFRKYGNTSFNTCLIQCRMENAKRLLETEPDMPLYQVAACVGYEDYAYFSKVFRQVVGCSPSKFQESLKSVK